MSLLDDLIHNSLEGGLFQYKESLLGDPLPQTTAVQPLRRPPLPPQPAPPPQPSLLSPPTPSGLQLLPQAPQPPAPPVAGPKMRAFGDAAATRQLIYENILDAARNTEPIKNQLHTLHLTDVDWDGPDTFTKAQQKNAILTGKTLARRLRGTWTLVDNLTGEPIDKKTTTIARVPHFTERGTFIHRGNEYTLAHQLRLKPGVFTRAKNNGEIEAHANTLPGQGTSHRYFLDPAKSVFYMKLGQAKMPLMSVLKVLGATDKQLQEAWGRDVWAENQLKDDPTVIKKLHQALVRKDAPDEGSMREQLTKSLTSMKFDPDVMQRTLGQPYDSLNLDSMLATTKKLLGVSRGEQDVDDRDHLAFQTVLGPEDLMSERVRKDYGRTRHGLLWKASMKRNLGGVQPGALDRQLEAALLTSGLGQALEEINPGEILDKQTKVSRLGEGGIPSIDSVPDEARSVQPSHFGFIDPVRTPESFRAGVDAFLASGAQKGADGRLYAKFLDPRTGQTVHKSPQDVSDLAVAFPGYLNSPGKRVIAMKGGRMRYVKRDEIDLVLPHFERAFSSISNMVPLKSAMKAQRAAMASRMLTQALPLQGAEAPLVRTGMPDTPDVSVEQDFGRHMGAVHAEKPGVVAAVTPDEIQIRHDDGTVTKHDLYNNWPFNRKTFIHNTAVVQPGQRVGANDLLAKSNYTDDKGHAALGRNLNVGYMPFKGYNFEDAIVISETAAKLLASEHAYQHGIEWEDSHKKGKSTFIGLFPGKFDRKTLDTIDDDGFIKPGQIVNYGDPLILAAKQKESLHNKLHRKREAGHTDASVNWGHHSPGEVTDVVKTDNGVQVVVKSLSPMEEGDKLSGRYGDKGVISHIVPDDQMPQRNGEPLHVLLNELGIISRANPSQMAEAALGKIAKLTGKPYNYVDFDTHDDVNDYAEQELRNHGLKDREDLIDPQTGRKIPQVFTGNRWFMKLHHTAESKGQGRSTEGYTMAGEPAKGGEHGAKRLSLMDQNALLSHGAINVMRDAGAIRGQRNEDYWLAFMQGHPPPPVKTPLVYEKFLHELKASGINVANNGSKMNIMALTDRDVHHLAGDREVKSGDTVHWDKGLKPVVGGLFDPALTGGHNGRRWSHIKLHEPMPNPAFEEPIRRVLGLTQSQFDDVIAGKHSLTGGTGPQGLYNTLAKINLPREIAIAQMQIKSGKRGARDQAVRKLGYLKSAQRLGIEPKDWILSKVPVLPPAFRPVSVMSGSKTPLVSDANYLYKELIEANQNLKQMSGVVSDTGDERQAVYHAFKAVTGLADPVHPKLQEKGVQGILKGIFGSSPKFGTVQRRLVGSTTDLVGRAVITPNPELDMDTVGLPENRAWDIYKNFIVRRLKRRGMPVTEALRHVQDRSGLAREAMVQEMDHRPVIINRAPVLHRFGIMAFKPRLVKGETLHVSPLVVTGFNADFDGDAMQYHVPVDEEARKEALERMLPSSNLLSPANFKSPMHKPGKEYLAGLHAATQNPSKRRPHTFRNMRDAEEAYNKGLIGIADIVHVLEDDEK